MGILFFKKEKRRSSSVVKIKVTKQQKEELKLLQKYSNKTPYDMLISGMVEVFGDLVASSDRNKDGREICWDFLDEYAKINKEV